jgi:hypothetical protein
MERSGASPSGGAQPRATSPRKERKIICSGDDFSFSAAGAAFDYSLACLLEEAALQLQHLRSSRR